jgi:hypothetical protein
MLKKIIDDKWLELSNDAKLFLMYLHYKDNPSGYYKFYPLEICKTLFSSNDVRTEKAINEIKNKLSDYIIITKDRGYKSKIIKSKTDFIPVYKEVYETVEKQDLKILSSKILFWTLNNLAETADFIDLDDHIEIKINDKLIKSLSYFELKHLFHNFEFPEFSLMEGVHYRMRICQELKTDIKKQSGLGRTLFNDAWNELIAKELINVLDGIIILYGLYDKKERGRLKDPFKELRDNFEPITVATFDKQHLLNEELQEYFGIPLEDIKSPDTIKEHLLSLYLQPQNKNEMDFPAFLVLERAIIKNFYSSKYHKKDEEYIKKLKDYLGLWNVAKNQFKGRSEIHKIRYKIN